MLLPPGYDRWMVEHHGVISRRVLMTTMGLTSRQVVRLVSTERLVPMLPGVFRSPAHPDDRLRLMVAACLYHPDVAVGFTTAGQEWRFRAMTDPRVHLLVPHGVNIEVPGAVVHRCRRIDPVDIALPRADGVRLTSPPRTLFDAAGIIGIARTASAIEQALAENRCTLATLLATDRRLNHPRRPGSSVFRRVLLSRPAWRGTARSDLEMVVLAAIRDHGLPTPMVNMRYVLHTGEVIYIDLAWPELKVAAEVDHPFWHDGAAESARDKRRDRKLAADGWLTPRLPEVDIDHNLPELMDDLLRILMVRGYQPAA